MIPGDAVTAAPTSTQPGVLIIASGGLAPGTETGVTGYGSVFTVDSVGPAMIVETDARRHVLASGKVVVSCRR